MEYNDNVNDPANTEKLSEPEEPAKSNVEFQEKPLKMRIPRKRSVRNKTYYCHGKPGGKIHITCVSHKKWQTSTYSL